MAKYIHKQAAIYALVNEANLHKNPIKRAYARAAAIIEQITAEDVQPVRRGEWEIFWQNGKPKLKCTNCHSLFDIRTNDKHICIYPKFCEECGADMMKEG